MQYFLALCLLILIPLPIALIFALRSNEVSLDDSRGKCEHRF